jgi:hypothetical protein
MPKSKTVGEADRGPAFEKRDLDPRQLVKVGIGFVAALALVLLVTTLLQYSWMGRAAPFSASAPSLNPPAQVQLPSQPRLEVVPGLNYQELHAHELEQLESYGWVDRSAGVVHIPITRAIDLILQRGLPVDPQHANSDWNVAGNQLPSDSSSGREMERVFP